MHCAQQGLTVLFRGAGYGLSLENVRKRRCSPLIATCSERSRLGLPRASCSILEALGSAIGTLISAFTIFQPKALSRAHTGFVQRRTDLKLVSRLSCLGLFMSMKSAFSPRDPVSDTLHPQRSVPERERRRSGQRLRFAQPRFQHRCVA